MFVEIKGFDNYLINKSGEIYSKYSKKKIKYFINTNKYPCYKLQKNKKQYNLLLHRLLAYVFKDLPSLDSQLEVDHIDRDVMNFSLDNLQVISRLEHLDKSVKDRGHFRWYSEMKEFYQCVSCGKSSILRILVCNNCKNKNNSVVRSINIRKEVKCLDCGIGIFRKSFRCKSCAMAYMMKDKKANIDIQELIFKVISTNWTQAGIFFNLSDNGLRKIYKKETTLNPKDIKKNHCLIKIR